jgi:sulfonate transport system substrate-binding protein
MNKLLLSFLLSVAAATPAWSQTVLRVGDQHAGVRSLLEASKSLDGLDYKIEWSQFPAAAPLLEALNANALDIGYNGDIATLYAYAAGAPIRVIGAVQDAPAANAVLVPAGSAAHSIADLKGKKIAVNKGGNGHFLALALLEKLQLKSSDVELVFLGPSDAKSAFANGAVDAWIIWDPYVALAEQEGARVIANAEGVFPHRTFENANVAAIATKREALQDFHDRVEKARLWALAHPDETARLVSTQTKLPYEIAHKYLLSSRITPVPVDGGLIKNAQYEQDLFARHGVLPKADVSGLFDTSFTRVKAAAR